MRYFLEIAYNGTDFCGFQIQQNAPSVQAQLNKALSLLLQSPILTVASGRTDTGVHCRQQFVHFDSPRVLDESFCYQLNKILPFSIAVHSLKAVQEQAHARFDALWRAYEYHICQKKNPFTKNLAYFYPIPLDLDLMNEAAQMLLDYQDFEAFSKTKTDVKTFICSIKNARWQQNPHGLVFEIRADRFLRGMVRTIVGTLLDIGRHKISLATWQQIILSKDRTQAGRAVPPEGLYLVEVAYPNHIFNLKSA